MKTVHTNETFAEPQLFAQGTQAGEFIFLAVDARGVDGTIGKSQTAEQARQCLFNLDLALHSIGSSSAYLVSLSVFLVDYRDAVIVAKTLHERFKDNPPAVHFVGVCELEGRCRVRFDAVATITDEFEPIQIANLPLPIGAGCHGVRIGNFCFLSGIDATDSNGEIAAPTSIQQQTTEVLTRIQTILRHEQLGLGNLCRTFMFMPGTQYRPGYGEARKRVYEGIFKEDEFPPNSGIYIRSLGENILLRSVAIAYRGQDRHRHQPKGAQSARLVSPNRRGSATGSSWPGRMPSASIARSKRKIVWPDKRKQHLNIQKISSKPPAAASTTSSKPPSI